MAYSILNEARVQGSLAPQGGSSRPYSVFWTENGDLEGWNTFVDLDIVGTWNGFLFATKTNDEEGYIGPTDTFVPVDALVNDRIFFRLKYDKHPKNRNPTSTGKIQWTTEADPLFDDDKSVEFDLLADGKWHLYELDLNLSPQWVGLINQVRFIPSIDGARNDEFFLNFFEIGTTDLPFDLDNPDAGLPGKVVGRTGLIGEITIEKDVNDRLLVNIDGFGFVPITLTPQTATPELIARDVSLQLGKVAIGGYIRAQARIDPDTKQLIIESGTRMADSSVAIQFGTNSAAPALGLTDVTGFFIGEAESGQDPSPGFSPISAYRPTTLELLSLFDNDNDLPAFGLDPQDVVVEAGRRDFALTGRRLATEVVIEGRGLDLNDVNIFTENSLAATSKTFIDINHPFTDDGKLDAVFMNGIADEDGGSKWKIFRPSLDGTLTLIDEGVIGETTITEDPNGGLVLSQEPGVFKADISTQDVFVRRGDLLGIFNVSLHVGAAGVNKPDAMYYEIDGDATGTIAPQTPSGAGEAGLPLYAVGAETKRQAVIDIDLGRRLNLDRIQIFGEESARDLEYNVAIANSTTFSVDIPGVHTICFTEFPVQEIRTCFERPNQAFNIAALNDDILYAENGITSFGDGGKNGVAGADADGATYFYVNGDAEHLGVFEFQGDDPKRFNFFRDPLGIDCIFSSTTPPLDKPIGKAAIYFKDRKNQRSWQIEYALGTGSKGGDGSKPGFQLIPADTINAVILDDKKKIERFDGVFLTQKTGSDLQTILLRNPVLLDVIADDGTRNPQFGVDFQQSAGELGGVNLREQATFIDFQWNKFQWEFGAVRTSAFRWYSDFHWSTKISEFQVFAVSDSQESLGDNVQVLFSADGEAFTSAELLRASTADAEYKLGNSPQFLRLVLRPTIDLSVGDIQVAFEEDQICFGPEGRLGSSSSIAGAKVGSKGDITPIEITNDTGQTADLILDLPGDIETARQLLYFNKLNSTSNITAPQVGPPGRINLTEDKVLKEEENVAINAAAYGLNNIVSGTQSFLTEDLLTNGGFEIGDLTGWDLNVVQSGTKRFQIPRVMAVSSGIDEDPAGPDFQVGDFAFGHALDSNVPEQEIDSTDSQGNIVPIEYTIASNVIDVNEFSESIDLGISEIELSFRYLAYFEPEEEGPVVRVLGSPTVSGINLSAGSVVNSNYGTNLLRESVLSQGTTVTQQTILGNGIMIISGYTVIPKPDTRYLKIEFEVDAESERSSGGITPQLASKFLLDDVELKLNLADPQAIKWYKSYRTGQGDFTDSFFVPVTEFVTTTGSAHWWQPFDSSADESPTGSQSPGFSNVFSNDRYKGIQSFSRMTIGDPGIIGAQWVGEKNIIGFRAVMQDLGGAISQARSCNYPRKFQLEVLKTKAELGGIDPDIKNSAHFKVIEAFRNVGPFEDIDDIAAGDADADRQSPSGPVVTFIFDEPVMTEGLRIVITTACDIQELLFWGSSPLTGQDFIDFNTTTTCPDNLSLGTGFSCTNGVPMSKFQPLEARGNTSLPVDNVIDWPNDGGNVFAAVDLGRVHNINTDSDLFELIAETVTQSEWNDTSAVFSADNTDDPNQVEWDGAASNARWVRFSTSSTQRFEDPNELFGSNFLDNASFSIIQLPQSILKRARIYPSLTEALIPTEGLNASWTNLGTAITDNNNSTFIHYSDWPVVALDLGKAYVLDNEDTLFRKKHEFVAGTPNIAIGDREYWNPNLDENFTYSSKSFKAADAPAQVEFLPFGSAPPDFAVRWVAFKGNGPLQISGDSGEKDYLFQSPGGVLFNSAWRPRNPEIFTENASWFTTSRAGLLDISTFEFGLGTTFGAIKDIDYGSNLENLGDPYLAFDGDFDTLTGDIWGVAVRDPQTNLEDPDNDFPHIIWRIFRDAFRGDTLAKNVKAFRVKGYNDAYYPTTFKVQRLKDGISVPEGRTAGERAEARTKMLLDSSWEDIENADFIDVDTFQDGNGFTFLLQEPVLTRGLRFVITDSVFVDDSVQTQVSDTGTGTFSTLTDVSGPQTRVSEIVIFEEVFEEAILEGQIDIDHAVSAVFSSTTSTPNHPPSLLNDGRTDTFWQSTGFQDTVTIDLPQPQSISRLEWIKDPTLGQQSGNLSTNAPFTFQLRAQIGVTSVVVLSEQGFIGTTFSGTLSNAPVTSDKFFLDIFEVQGEQEDADSIVISELRLIEESIQQEPLVTIESTTERHPTSTNVFSTKLQYAADSTAVASVFMDGIDGNNDEFFSERDFFQLYLKISDINLLDTNFGSIRLGNSSDVYYQWDLKNIPNLQTGWNKLKLQFSKADDTSAIEFKGGPDYDPNFGISQVDFVTPDIEVSSSVDGVTNHRIIQAPGIRYFELKFRGTGGSSPLEFIVDDMQFVRNRFDDVAKFNSSLYLNNSETFQILLEGLDLAAGTVEFWIQPDWDTAARIRNDELIIPTIFRVIRPDGLFLSLIYRPNTGFVAIIFDGEKLLQFESLVTAYRFERFESFHFALAWDARRQASKENASLVMYVNGEPVFGNDRTWRALRRGGSTIVFGGEAGQRFASSPHNSAALAFTAVPTLPAKNTASAWALLENIKIYNYAKTNFDDINSEDLERTQLVTPSSLVEISLDGVNFEKSGSASLPLVSQAVPAGESRTVYVRTDIPKGLTGDETRDASMLVRWKTPLRQCN